MWLLDTEAPAFKAFPSTALCEVRLNPFNRRCRSFQQKILSQDRIGKRDSDMVIFGFWPKTKTI